MGCLYHERTVNGSPLWRGPIYICRPVKSEHDLDRFLLGVAQELGEADLLADAGILEAAIGCALEIVADAIDPHAAGLQAARGLDRALDVVGPHRAGETVLERIGKLDDGVLVTPGEHRNHRAENLLACDLHLRMHVAEHGRLDPPAALELLAGGALAADHQFGAVVDAGF